MEEKVFILKDIAELLNKNEFAKAEKEIDLKYAFTPVRNTGRKYSTMQKLNTFFRDGFINRYSGDKLVNPGMLRVISKLCPEKFPYHPNWDYILTASYYSKDANGNMCKVPGQDYEPDFSYIYEQNIKDFYQNVCINMDFATLVINKGVKTSEPAKKITITCKDLTKK